MSRPRIFITQPVGQSAIERLQGVAEVEWNPDPVHIVTKDELLSAVRGHDILFCLLHDKVDGEVIAANPGLRAIASMKTIYWTPRRKPEAEEREAGLTYVPFEQLLAESDFVSVHAPLTPETRHLIGARELRLMKPSAFIVNTARGAIIDETALVQALAERRIAGAGLDVFEDEPRVAPELLAMSNVVLTPHLGSAVRELREQMAHIVVDNILAVIEGKQPPNCWNPEIYSAPG